MMYYDIKWVYLNNWEIKKQGSMTMKFSTRYGDNKDDWLCLIELK